MHVSKSRGGAAGNRSRSRQDDRSTARASTQEHGLHTILKNTGLGDEIADNTVTAGLLADNQDTMGTLGDLDPATQNQNQNQNQKSESFYPVSSLSPSSRPPEMSYFL